MSEWDLKLAFIITEAGDEDFEPVIFEGTSLELLEYKRWYAIHNHVSMSSIRHDRIHIVTCRPTGCDGYLENCGATTQAQYLAGKCPKCDP